MEANRPDGRAYRKGPFSFEPVRDRIALGWPIGVVATIPVRTTRALRSNRSRTTPVVKHRLFLPREPGFRSIPAGLEPSVPCEQSVLVPTRLAGAIVGWSFADPRRTPGGPSLRGGRGWWPSSRFGQWTTDANHNTKHRQRQKHSVWEYGGRCRETDGRGNEGLDCGATPNGVSVSEPARTTVPRPF